MRSFVLAACIACALAECGFAATRKPNDGFISIAERRRLKAEAEAKRSGKAPAPKKQQPMESAAAFTEFLGPSSGWGYVRAESPYYSPDGKNLGKLEAGTLFKYSGVRKSEKCSMLVSLIRGEGGEWKGPFLLSCVAVAAYEGDPAKIDPATVSALGKCFALDGKIAGRKAELEEEAAKENPHYESAKTAQAAWLESVGKAAALEKKMEAATGTRRSRMQNELREIKYGQVALKAKSEKEVDAFREWKDAHPLGPDALANDPRIKAWAAERAVAAEPVKNLLPEPIEK